jgi:hypothetical protein
MRYVVFFVSQVVTQQLQSERTLTQRIFAKRDAKVTWLVEGTFELVYGR